MKKIVSAVLIAVLVIGTLCIPPVGFVGSNVDKSYGASSSLRAPANVIVKKYGTRSLKVSWKKVTGASGYVVYRATSKSGTYKRMKAIYNQTTLSWTNKRPKKNKTYYYKVRSFKVSKGKTQYGSYSPWVSGRAYTSGAKVVNAGKVTVTSPGVLYFGGTVKATAKVSPVVSGKSVISHSVRWVTSNSAIATIDSYGNVRAKNVAGTCTITAKAHNGLTGSMNITVKSPIPLDKPAGNIKIGQMKGNKDPDEPGILKWPSVNNATGYSVTVNGITYSTKDTNSKIKGNPDGSWQMDIYKLNLPLGSYAISLKALGNNAAYKDSAVETLQYEEKFIRDLSMKSNFNYGQGNQNDYWIQTFTNFSLKEDLLFDNAIESAIYQTAQNPYILDELYATFLSPTSTDEQRSEAASKIGSDIIVTYYYINNNTPEYLLTTTNLPLVKNKLWSGWLWPRVEPPQNGNYYPDTIPNGNSYGPLTTLIGQSAPAQTPLRIASNIASDPSTTGSSWTSYDLKKITGKTLYIQVNVIVKNSDGSVKYYQETVSENIQGWPKPQ